MRRLLSSFLLLPSSFAIGWALVVLALGPGLASAAVIRGPVRPAAGGGSSLVGWWKLNDGSGTTAVDDSGNGNNGTLTNSPTWTTGPNSNGALAMVKASNQYVSIGNVAALNITSALSISVWVNLAAVNSDQMFVTKDTDTGRSYVLSYQYEGGTQQKFGFYINGGTAVYASGAVPSTGTWYHVVGTYDPADSGGTLRIYRDGSLIATLTGAGTSINSNSTTVMIGRRAYPSFEDNLDGTLDDVRIYNVKLTDSEVSALYAAGAQ